MTGTTGLVFPGARPSLCTRRMIEQRYGKNNPLSVFAPLAVSLLPALLLGFLPGKQNELYDWSQHLVDGLAF